MVEGPYDPRPGRRRPDAWARPRSRRRTAACCAMATLPRAARGALPSVLPPAASRRPRAYASEHGASTAWPPRSPVSPSPVHRGHPGGAGTRGRPPHGVRCAVRGLPPPLRRGHAPQPRERGMYRQNFCGCRFSRGRGRRRARASARRARAAEARGRGAPRTPTRSQPPRKPLRAAQASANEQAYAEKQARKRAALRALREQERGER